ncbi:MAG: sugar ABC transporter ATP-binding protein [Clostridia bacterium]|nr:sugar ABC transporter ATP-binding protein [Clostridia bacterium]
MEKLLHLKQINKAFNSVQVLFDVDLELYSGDVLCLVGENGAGKSTLIKILSGAEAPSSGTIEVFGKSFSRMHLRDAIDMGIAVIYQDADLVDTLTIADNVFLGEELKKGPFVDRKRQEKITQEIIDKLGLDLDAGTPVSALSPGQKQCTQIVKAVKRDARIVVMDEPTSSLGKRETEALMRLVKQLAAEGRGIIYISHYLEEVFELGNRALVLKDGHYICTMDLKDTTPDELVQKMVGRSASSFYAREASEIREGTLEVRDYCAPSGVKHVSFTVRRGEIFGLGGLAGAGRSELMRAVYGCDPKTSGTLLIDGEDITPKSPKDAVAKGFYMIFENRKQESMFNIRPISENIMISHNERKEFIDLKKERETVDFQIQDLHIKTFSQEVEGQNLSGGNQQKMVLSRWLVDDGRVYVFDEPTKGVDVGAKEEIYRRIVSLAKQGKYVIVISSVLPELISLSDRIGVMRNGELVNIVDRSEASESSLVKEFIGIQ